MDQTRHYITIISHRLQALLRQIDELSRLDFPSNSPVVLSEILKRILLRLFNELADLYKKAESSTNQDILERARIINYSVIWIGKLTESIQGAQIASNSSPMSSIIEAFEEICGRIAYSTKVIIYPQWIYNASFLDAIPKLGMLSRYINNGNHMEIFKGEPSHIPIITFPAIEGKNYLRQSILAHEVGHFVDATHSFSELIVPKCKEIGIKKAESQLTSPKSRKMASDIIEAWIPEIIADIIGLNILGPAYLFALDDVSHIPPSLTNSLLSQTHPPFSLRAKLTSQYCRNVFISPVYNSESRSMLNENELSSLNYLESWLEYLGKQTGKVFIFSGSDLPEKEQKIIYNIGKNALELGVKLILHEIQKFGSESWICSPIDICDAIKLQIFLENGLPPSELPFLANQPKRYPTFAAIMNSGWIFSLRSERKYSYFEEEFSSLEPKLVFEKYMKVQNLIAKAVENYLFRAEFIRRRGKGND